MPETQGKIIIFTGNAKGKTTAALGLAVVAAANNQSATVIQFLKGGGYTGELSAQQFLAPYLQIRQFGYGCSRADAIRLGSGKCNKCGVCFRENCRPKHGFAVAACDYAEQVVTAATNGIVVLDEISHAIRRGLLPLERVSALIAKRPPGLTMVLTGRQMPDELIKLADQVTECVMVKHPLTAGIDARRGSEY